MHANKNNNSTKAEKKNKVEMMKIFKVHKRDFLKMALLDWKYVHI